MPVIDGARLRASRACRSDRPGTPGCGAIDRDVNPGGAVRDPAVRRPSAAGARLLVATIAAGACAVVGATRVFAQPEAAYETALAEVTLPAGPVGRVTFPPWAGCTPVSLPASPCTIDLVERAEVSLDALVRAAADAAPVAVNGRPIVDETGFISPDAQSAWSLRPDGRSVTRCGVASRLPAPEHRRIAAARDAGH